MSDSGGFTPTDRVPPAGMHAWLSPDPDEQPIETLQGSLPVQVTTREGAWAQIVCSNGWTGWVDGRSLIPFSTTTTTPPPRAAPAPAPDRTAVEYERDRRSRGRVRTAPEFLPLLGSLIAIVGTFLPWYRAHSVTAHHVGAFFTVGLSEKPFSGTSAGLVIIVASVAGIILSWLDIPAGARHGMGLIITALPVGLTIRTAIAVHEHFASALGTGIVACIVGGVLLLASPHRKRRLTD